MSLPIYVITLKRTPERTLYIQRQLDAMGLDYQIVYGIDKYDLSSKEYRLKIASQLVIPESDMEYRYTNKNKQGGFAISLSHIKVYDLMIKNKIPQACILEDDILLSPIFPKLLANIQKFSWDMVLLSSQSEFNTSLIYNFVRSKSVSEIFEVLRRPIEFTKRYPMTRWYAFRQYMMILRLVFYLAQMACDPRRPFPRTKYEKENVIYFYSSRLGALPVPDKSSWFNIIDNYYMAKPFEPTSSAMAYTLNLDTAIKYKEIALTNYYKHIDDIPWYLSVENKIELFIVTPPCGYAERRYLYYSPRQASKI